jgi:serine/threonine protein kinase/tetratricopeptide (TPR) repeat protein
MLRCWLNQLEVLAFFPGFQQGMSDPQVPNTSDSESPTLAPQGNTKLESAPPWPDSSEAPTLLGGGRGTSDSDAATILAGPPPTRGPAASDAPTRIDGLGSSSPPPRPRPTSSAWQLPALAPGMMLGGRYEILQTIGEGGMGAVYKAEDRELGRTVALKVIRPELASDPEILQRFKQEILLASKVTDRNIIRIYDLGDADGIKFITMEFVEGDDLRHLLQRHGKLPAAEAVDIMEQVVSGLRAAHRVGVIHRDLKPGNIMRAGDGRVLVMDFGLARTLQGDGMTRTGTMLGTMEYMSPEQAHAKDLDARSDIFTVGLILFELLTGVMPYHAESAIASLLKRTQQRAIPVSDIDKNVPGALSNVVSKCLERDPALRYQTSEELLNDLWAWQGRSGTSRVSASSTHLRINRLREVPWSRLPPVTLLLVVILAATAWYFSRKRNVAVVTHAPMSVLVADFQNNTSDTLFDETLEPMVNVALEGASFINAYNRSTARHLAGKLPNPTSKLDENAARLVAVNEGVAAIVTGSLSSSGGGYTLAVKAIDAVTGKTLASANSDAAGKDELLLDIPKVIAPIRQALGDTMPKSVQIEKVAGAFTASSLAAVHQYGIAMEQLLAGNSEEAIRSFSNAIALDPNFARAYGGMASAYGNLGRTQDSEKYVKLAMEHVDRMTERERYRVRGLYYFATSNYPKCIEEYGELVKRFPADDSAWANSAACYLSLRRIPEAVAAAQRAVEIVPKGAVQRAVLSFCSSYGGDFAGGEREAQTALELNPSSQAYLALAEAQLGLSQIAQAAETYHKMEKVDALGASLAASGLADIASYEGRYADAVPILEQGVAADMAAKNADNAAEKLAGVAQLHLFRGQKGPAVDAATKAVSISQSVPVRVLAARALLKAGEIAKAQKLADGLASEIQPETQAYAKIIRGDLALQRGEKNEAINMFTSANQLVDTWIGRFELGRAYLEAGMFVEADSEFDRCMKRRGEALEIFQDNNATFSYFPPIYYYQGRMREGLKSPGFAEPFRTYLSIRGQAGEDPLLADIHRRLGQ